MVFTVRLAPAASGQVSVRYRTRDVTATEPADYTAVRNGTLVFAAGVTEKTVEVPIVDDAVEDSGESFALILSQPSGARLRRGGAYGIIRNTEDVLLGFTLVDAAAGTELGVLADGAELMLADPSNRSFGVRVEAAPEAAVGSVGLALSGAKAVSRTDDAAPWSLYGEDAGGALGGEGLPAGAYTLVATAYSEAALGGEALQTLEVSFTVTAGAAAPEPEPEPAGPLAGVVLADLSTGTVFGPLADGAEIELADPANGRIGVWVATREEAALVRAARAAGRTGVRVEAAPYAAVGSVGLALSGAKTASRTDNTAPYSLYGEAGGEVQGEGLPAGGVHAGGDGVLGGRVSGARRCRRSRCRSR